MVTIIIAVILLCLAIWLISIAPAPFGNQPFNWILMVLAVLIFALFILGYV